MKLIFVQEWESDGQVIKATGSINLRDDVSRLEGEFEKMQSDVEFLKYGWKLKSEKVDKVPIDKTSKIC